MLAPDDPRHGTANGYGNLGCRCDRCQRAAADKAREWSHRTGRKRPWAVYLAELRQNPPPPHGTEARYVRHRCRCSECRHASAEARRHRRAKVKGADA